MLEQVTNISPDGNRVEKLSGKYEPKVVQQKVLALLGNEKIKAIIDDELNRTGNGIDIDQLENIGLFEELSEQQRIDISSTIGDIKFHANQDAANDPIFKTMIVDLAHKLAA